MKSLDQLDREAFAPGPSPHSGPATPIELAPGAYPHLNGPVQRSLDGEWLLAEGGVEERRLSGDWEDAIPARVPGSVHTALLEAGRIPDPYVGKNDDIARKESFKTWWLSRSFARPADLSQARLHFGGICDACAIWLNGEKLSEHKGMFSALEYDVSDFLVDGENRLVVRIDPAPQRISSGEPNDFFIGMNVGWLDTAVINNIYGWHYINLPALGIWRSVTLRGRPQTAIVDPFLATMDADAGLVRLSLKLKSDPPQILGCLRGTITAENFDGQTYRFTCDAASSESETTLLLELSIPDAKLWWPVDYGYPHLYRMRLTFLPESGLPDTCDFTFGIRAIEMAPLPGGPDPETYNWTFVVNGRPMFIKGANWCTLDALLRFDRERYERFIHLARDSHMQLLRAWGSGMPETDEFYDVADRCGLMILQEWPTAWNSHRIQPYAILEETVRCGTIRLRNHPSLVMWGGGNESSEPTGPAIDMMGRASCELDGTRPFHRGEPWGGSIHSYRVYWGREVLDSNLSLTAPFIGEFGLASVPNIETTERFLPDDERYLWPPPADGGLTRHMPVFNQKGGMAILSQYAADFLPNDSLEHFILGTQMAQATGMRHTLELARVRWPDATGIAYYKLTDNNPAASWATVDWYGAPKIAYHILRQAYRPLHVCVLFERLSFVGVPVNLPVFLLDDNAALSGRNWRIKVRAYGSELGLVKEIEFTGSGEQGSVHRLGELRLTGDETWNCPMFIVAEIAADDELSDRVFYWLNYTSVQGCLFNLPKTRLTLSRGGDNYLTISNDGDYPAVGVHFLCPQIADEFSCHDSFFWLDAGERRTIETSHTRDVNAAAWNADGVGLSVHE